MKPPIRTLSPTPTVIRVEMFARWLGDSGPRCRRGRRCWRGAIDGLPPGNIIGRKNLLVADDRIHHRDHLLPGGIGMSKPEPMAKLVQKNAPNIGDRSSLGRELERTAIGVKVLGLIKEHVRFGHGRARVSIVSHGERVRAESLAENGARENDGIQMIAR